MKEVVLQHMTDREREERETTQVQDCGPFHSAALSFDTHGGDLIKTPWKRDYFPSETVPGTIRGLFVLGFVC